MKDNGSRLAGVPTEEPQAAVLDWKEAANSLCAAMLDQAPAQVLKISDALYGTLLDSIQDYLRENVDYNLSSELMRAKKYESDANRALQSVAIALGVDTHSFPAYPTPEMVADQCIERYNKARTAAEAGAVGIAKGDEPK